MAAFNAQRLVRALYVPPLGRSRAQRAGSIEHTMVTAHAAASPPMRNAQAAPGQASTARSWAAVAAGMKGRCWLASPTAGGGTTGKEAALRGRQQQARWCMRASGAQAPAGAAAHATHLLGPTMESGRTTCAMAWAVRHMPMARCVHTCSQQRMSASRLGDQPLTCGEQLQ